MEDSSVGDRAVSSFEPSGIIDADPTTTSISAAEQKKLEKAEKALKKKRDKWKVFVDFLLRHISIVTTKYVAWEKNDFESFKVRKFLYVCARAVFQLSQHEMTVVKCTIKQTRAMFFWRYNSRKPLVCFCFYDFRFVLR